MDGLRISGSMTGNGYDDDAGPKSFIQRRRVSGTGLAGMIAFESFRSSEGFMLYERCGMNA